MDDELERLAMDYAGRDFRERQRGRIETFNEYGSETWSPAEFLAAITKAISAIPPDATDAIVELEGGYDESTKLTISYSGLEDDSVVADRVARSLEYARNVLAGERNTFERLKRKFEASS